MQQDGPPRGGPPSPAAELARMDHALTLTDAQKTAIMPILQKRQTGMQALRQSTPDPEAGREQMHTLMQASNTQIRALLTEAQQKLFDTMRPGRGPRPGSGGSNGEGPPPPPSDGAAPPSGV